MRSMHSSAAAGGALFEFLLWYSAHCASDAGQPCPAEALEAAKRATDGAPVTLLAHSVRAAAVSTQAGYSGTFCPSSLR